MSTTSRIADDTRAYIHRMIFLVSRGYRDRCFVATCYNGDIHGIFRIWVFLVDSILDLDISIHNYSEFNIRELTACLHAQSPDMRFE